MASPKLPSFLNVLSKPKKLDFSVYKKEAKSVEKWVKAYLKDGEKYLNDPNQFTRNKLGIMVLIGERNLMEFKAENEELKEEITRLKNRIKYLE